MKTKILVIVCLLTSIGLTQLFAQKGNSNGTKSEQGWKESTYWFPIYSGGQIVDFLECVAMVHFVDHFKNGSLRFEIDQIKGEAKSVSGEVFEIRESDKYDFTDGLKMTCKFKFVGDRGSRYTGVLTYSTLTGEFTFEMSK